MRDGDGLGARSKGGSNAGGHAGSGTGDDAGFPAETVAYLRSLPVVTRVAHGRIQYADEFKRYVMHRYRAGDSPARIFSDAGLPSSLIGYKRIERCIHRWKSIPETDGNTDIDPTAEIRTAEMRTAEMRAGDSCVGADPSAYGVDSPSHGGEDAPSSGVAGAGRPSSGFVGYGRDVRDMRDLLIVQQIERIDELERENARLRSLLAVVRVDPGSRLAPESGTPATLRP